MKSVSVPFNLSLLSPTPQQLQRLRPITSLDIFDGPGGNFHDDGLFSTVTFGRVGDPDRDRRFGYIPLKIDVLHPVMYSRLIKLKSLYKGILSGQEYAKWNPEENDFEAATELDGATGYAFFMTHWEELSPKKTGSSSRDMRVELINRYRHQATLKQLLVMPAGLRDADIDSDNRVSMDEINELYQNVLMLVRNLPDQIGKSDLPLYDRTRFVLTLRLLAIYEYIENLISGKKGFIQGRWASRRVFNGTRNVISSMDTSVPDLESPNRPRFNDCQVGLYQAAKAVLPKTIYSLKTSVVGDIFSSTSNNVELVDPKTYKRVWVEVSNEDMDRWSTDEGLEKVVNDLGVIEKRHRYVEVAGHYLALVYVDNEHNYRLLRSIDEVPEGWDTKWVRPITYVELIYLAGLSMWYKNHAFITRYPVTGMYSSIPVKSYVKTTVVGELRYPLNHEFERDESLPLALEYPRLEKDPQYHDALSVNPITLEQLGGDFDGDTISYLATYSKEANEEAERHFNSRKAYLDAGGGLAFSVNIHTIKLALRFMTGDPVETIA